MKQLQDAVAALDPIRTKYGDKLGAQRRRLLRAACRCPINDAVALVGYHEVLMFICAFPDDTVVLDLARSELERVHQAAKTMTARGRRPDLKKLDDSGIAGTVSYGQFSVQTATWLAERYRRDSEIAWEDESAGSGLETMLGALVESVEMNGLDDVTMSTYAWFRLARGKVRKRDSDLLWVLRHFARLELQPYIRERMFDLLELRIRWRLHEKSASRTFARFPRRRPHYQQTPLTRDVDVSDILNRPPAKGGQCARSSALKLIDIARSVLAVRHRETDPVTFASVDDVSSFDMGAGIDVVLFGHVPGHRTPIETYYGFILAKNRVPVAYGGGWVFCGRCEIGLNIFDTFRGGESMNTFGQLLRLYRQRFNVDRFTVDPYQIGAGNSEAIRSAAFWFYYRFGFRSQDAATQVIAEREWTRLHHDDHYRSSSRVLRRLAEQPLELVLNPIGREDFFEPVEISLGVTRWIGKRFQGERASARRWSIDKVHRACGTIDQTRWRAPEIAAFEDFCLLLGPIGDLGGWPREDKDALIRLMRAKGGLRERAYAAQLKRHQRLRQAWKTITAAGL